MFSQTGTLWARLEAAAGAVAPFRDAALDRWHRKALLAAGGGAQHGSLRALDQAISAQARTAPPWGAARPLLCSQC